MNSQPRMGRRDLLQVGGLSAFGLTLSGWLRSRAQAAHRLPLRAQRCVLIWLDGGPSHLDTFDLKPGAPAEVRGPFQPIATTEPGLQISEMLPETARQAGHLAIIRSMTSPLGEHNFGSHYLLTGYRPTPVLQYPGYGSVLTHLRGDQGLLPANISVPSHNREGGAGYLPPTCEPFALGGDPSRPDFQVRDLSPFAGVDDVRINRRRQFLAAFDQLPRADSASDMHRDAQPDPQFEQAFRLIASPAAQRAFDLSQEPAAVRSRYGLRTIGQSCLMARRLLEAGVGFVTVRDTGWDTHENMYTRLKEGFTGGSVGKVPLLDQAYAALLSDLYDRGMLDETLVVMMGEFGRTPKINTAGGRDHWPRVFSVVVAGAGIAGGQIIGASDANAESPADRPVAPEDLARTIYTLLGIDPDLELQTPDGRPVAVNRGGTVIRELL